MRLFLRILGTLVSVVLICSLIQLLGLRILFVKNYDTKDLIENYEAKTDEIIAVKNYIKAITPEGLGVFVEFNSRSSIDMRVWKVSDSTENKVWFQQWDIDPYHYKNKPEMVDLGYGEMAHSLKEVTEKLDWQAAEFRELKAKLDRANCISAEKLGDVYTIGFQRSAMGKYHYKLFENHSTAEIKEQFDDGCLFKYYKDQVVLEYMGGAVGMQCFEDFNWGEDEEQKTK